MFFSYFVRNLRGCHFDPECNGGEKSQEGRGNTRFLTFTSFWFGMTSRQMQTGRRLDPVRMHLASEKPPLPIAFDEIVFVLAGDRDSRSALFRGRGH